LLRNRRKLYNLPSQAVHKREVFRLRVAYDYVVICGEKYIDNFAFRGEGFTAAGRA
jgi:hypothetical protein